MALKSGVRFHKGNNRYPSHNCISPTLTVAADSDPLLVESTLSTKAAEKDSEA